MLTDPMLYSVSLKSSAAGANTVFVKDSCNLTTTIQGYTGTTDVVKTSPVVNPYGFSSIPDQSYTAVVGNMGIRSQQPVVLGYTNGVTSASPLAIEAGETGLYNSTSYAIELKLTEVRARFNGISCKIMNGDSTQQILIDTVGELISLISYINTNVVIPYNIHVHTVPGPATSSVPTVLLTPFTENPNLPTDQTYLNNNECFINNEGAVL